MGPYILTSSPDGLQSSSLMSTASPARLALPTTTSEASVLAYTSSTPLPTPSLGVLPERWALPSGCSLPGSHFTPPFGDSDGFPTSWFSRGLDSGNSCDWSNTSSSTSTSSMPSATLDSPTPARSTFSINAIIGIAVGAGVVAILLATGLVFCIMRRRRRRDESDSPRASLLPVAYPITRPRRARMSSSGVSSPPLSELQVDAPSEQITVGVLESKSLANCSIVPRLSVSSPLPGSIGLAGPASPEGPCRAEKALMQLRDMDRRPATAPSTDDVATASERRWAEAVRAGSDGVRGAGAQFAGSQESNGLDADPVSDRLSHSHLDLDLDSDMDSRTTLPPPYSSHPSFEREAV